MKRLPAWWVMSATLSLLACGSTSSDSPGAGGGGGASASGGASAGSGGAAAASGVGGVGGSAASGGAGGVAPGCPSDTPPTAGSECVPGAAICQYSCESCKCATGKWECAPHECKKLCSHPGAWCETSTDACLCWGGSFTCANSDAGTAPAGLPSIVADGESCTDAQMVCSPHGSNGEACKCAAGKWDCAPQATPNQGCPSTVDDGAACSTPGQYCQTSGFCKPVCVCQHSGTWSCALFTPC